MIVLQILEQGRAGTELCDDVDVVCILECMFELDDCWMPRQGSVNLDLTVDSALALCSVQRRLVDLRWSQLHPRRMFMGRFVLS